MTFLRPFAPSARITAGILYAEALLMVWSSRFGKLRERDRLLDSMTWRGDERVLDVGCGRGLLLVGAARRVPQGKAVGIDLWRSEDQSGHHPDLTLENARAAGVVERAEVQSGDMQQMPFPDASFDVVVSSLAIHNISDRAGRAQAMREIARGLKPGGRAALLDFRSTAEYERALRELGWKDVRRTGLHFTMFPPVRWVTGTKPA
jgi:ubiquinone/menaquinone biosynthesis C-methylase UbiE